MGEVIWGRFKQLPEQAVVTLGQAVRDHPRWAGFLLCMAIGLGRMLDAPPH